MRFVHVLMFIHISDHFEGFRVTNVTRFRIGIVLFVKVNPDRKEVGVNSVAKNHTSQQFAPKQRQVNPVMQNIYSLYIIKY